MKNHLAHTAIAAALLVAFQPVDAALPDDEAAIVVTATRQATRTRELLSDVTVLGRGEIEQAGASTIGELLSRQPGLQVATTGGAGAATSVFIRGANPGHTLLLVDGLRVGSATTGQPAFETIPLAQIERIEILRGPASAVYGADAIGGVIQIFTRRGDGSPRADAFVGIGTQGSYEANIGYAGRRDDLSFSLRAGYNETQGFDALGIPPDRDGFRQEHLGANVALQLRGGGQLAANYFQSSGINKYDGGTAYDNRIHKKAAIYSVTWTQPVTADWKSTVRLGQTHDGAKTFDPTYPSDIATKSDQFVWQNDIRLPVGKGLLAYEMLSESVSNSEAALTTDHRRTDSLLLGWGGNFGSQRLQINARRDDSTQYGGHNAGSLSYGYQFTSDWRGYASVGRAFKAPTFNDLYFPLVCFPHWGCFGGNPNLRPERANNREAGLIWERGAHQASMVRFDNRISDLIVWASQPFNVGKARLRGTTLAYALNGSDWQAGVSYTDQQARDVDTDLPLLRRADRQLTASLARDFSGWRIGAEWQAVAARDDYDFANSVRVRLGGYGIVNAFARRALAPDWMLEVRGNNIGDKKYQQALNFTAPGASLFVGIRYTPK